MMDLQLLTTREAAEYLRITERRLREWIQKGYLPCIQLPGRGKSHEYRLKLADLLNCLQRHWARNPDNFQP